ncbi:hypothetical protein RV10_GL004658 [Enterococcus pallens]|nr:hypothetical protein RV10_GL004658 [Enterococcus pallens]
MPGQFLYGNIKNYKEFPSSLENQQRIEIMTVKNTAFQL